MTGLCNVTMATQQPQQSGGRKDKKRKRWRERRTEFMDAAPTPPPALVYGWGGKLIRKSIDNLVCLCFSTKNLNDP